MCGAVVLGEVCYEGDGSGGGSGEIGGVHPDLGAELKGMTSKCGSIVGGELGESAEEGSESSTRHSWRWWT